MSKKNNYKVYVHINKINGKRYFGITGEKKVEKRWGKNGYGYRGNQYFYRAINEYGWDNFEHIVVAKGLTEEEAKWLEVELIREHDTTNKDKGYNITKGGDDNPMDNEEVRKKHSKAMKVMKGKNSPRATKIYCVELEQYFDTINEASEYVGCCRSNISSVLTENGRSKTAKGYHWIYANEVNEENINKAMSQEYNEYTGKPTKVYCVELDKYFNSITEASEFVGCHRSSISDVLGKNRTTKGYHWLRAEDVNEENINKVMSLKTGKGIPRRIYCIELDMYFNTVKEASEFVGCCVSAISNVLSPNCRNKTCKGYHWIYAEDVETIDIENNKVS